MPEIQLEAGDILTKVQEMFPREYTIAVQTLHIQKLEEIVDEKKKEPVE